VIQDSSSNPRKLWQSFSTILGKPPEQSVLPLSFTATEFLDFMEGKLEKVRQSTVGSPPPTFETTDYAFNAFEPCSNEKIRKIIGGAQSKSCELDPMPTFLLKEHLDVLLPFIMHKDV